MNMIESLKESFCTINDPRIDRTKKHKLVDIIIIALFSMMCGMKGWEEIELFANEHIDWFKTFLELQNGIPSHDTFYRVFSKINPKEFNNALLRWVETLNINVEGKVVAIDGKTLRGSFDTATGKGALHMVNAWTEDNNLVLGQVSVESKKNEITSIPILLRLLELKGAIVTIDAIGCQKEIVNIIREENEAEYVLALKKNQPTLYNEVEDLFKVVEQNQGYITDTASSVEKGHGRIEQRTCTCIELPKQLDYAAHGWKDLNTVGKIHSIRDEKGKIEEQTRYFISSLPCNAKQIAHAVRTHWGVENCLHWRLDVTYQEDASRIRKGHAPENMAILRRLAFSLVKARAPHNMSVKRTMLRMVMNWGFAEKYIFSK